MAAASTRCENAPCGKTGKKKKSCCRVSCSLLVSNLFYRKLLLLLALFLFLITSVLSSSHDLCCLQYRYAQRCFTLDAFQSLQRQSDSHRPTTIRDKTRRRRHGLDSKAIRNPWLAMSHPLRFQSVCGSFVACFHVCDSLWGGGCCCFLF